MRRKFNFTPPVLVVPEAQQSYRVDADGSTFHHSNISIGEQGMQSVDFKRAENKMGDIKMEDLEILGVLGQGNSSVVKKARVKTTGQLVAVKQMNIYDRERRHQLVSEIDTLYRADCPHLIDFYGAFFKEGKISIVLELMDAGALDDVLKKVGHFPEPQLACLTRQILSGLLYLRERQQAHRDIKPANICVSRAARAKLSDFGISTNLDNTLEACDTFVGTCNYMAPERIMGQRYSYAADIWSLGLLLMECASGQYPYPVTAVYLELMTHVVKGPEPRLPVGSFSEELRDFCACCVQKDPERRASPAELLRHPWLLKCDTMPRAAVAEWLVERLDREAAASAAGGGSRASTNSHTSDHASSKCNSDGHSDSSSGSNSNNSNSNSNSNSNNNNINNNINNNDNDNNSLSLSNENSHSHSRSNSDGNGNGNENENGNEDGDECVNDNDAYYDEDSDEDSEDENGPPPALPALPPTVPDLPPPPL